MDSIRYEKGVSGATIVNEPEALLGTPVHCKRCPTLASNG